MLTKDEIIFVVIWLLNLILSAVYLLWGIFIYIPAKKYQFRNNPEKNFDNKTTYLIRFFVMILCPIVGFCFFLIGNFTYQALFHRSADLTDVIFSKERVRQHLKADEEKERNMASLEETIAVGDSKNLRSLIMNIIQRDLEGSLSSVVWALDSDDSETSHYAASALQDIFNDFRLKVQQLLIKIENEDKKETAYEEELIDYMGEILIQKIFTNIEQKKYVETLEQTAEKMYEKDATRFITRRYEIIVLCLLDIDEYEKAELWCNRMTEQHPEELETYKCGLRFFYKTKNKDKFFELLEKLKHSDITLDNETLNIIRVFQ